jgi:1-acyl-sn-glycerol-3-phosphate acyltransferase
VSGGLVLVAAADPAADALFRHLRREWAGAPGAGACELLTGSAAAVAARVPGRRTMVYGAVWRCPDPCAAAAGADAGAVLAAAAAAGCRLVLLSSTEVYEPHHHHPGLVAEERRVAGAGAGDGAGAGTAGGKVCDAWLALESRAAAVAAAAGVPLTVLRAAPMPVRGGADAWSRRLARRVVPTVTGHDPPIQLLAPEDLARALALAASASPPPGAAATYNVVPDGTVPVHRAVRLAGARRLPVPWPPDRGSRRDSLRYPWSAGGERAQRELGFTASLSSAEVAARMGPGGGEVAGARGVDLGWEWGSAGLDPFGMDRGYVERYGRTLFRFLHDRYWRIEARGLEHVPATGPAVLTGVHRGFMPYDGVMALHLLSRERGRYPRFLLHPTLTKFLFLSTFMTRLGGVFACRENADWVLERGGIVGIFPEGIRGAFTPYRRAYRLGKMGRDEYVRMALANRAPILPFVTVGSAEIFPVLARFDWGWWKRLTEWPCFPIAPPFPLLPVPLPSKWHTRFLEPLHVEREHGPEAADDPAVVRAIGREVRRRMEGALAEMLARRRHVFFGSLFGPEGAAPRVPAEAAGSEEVA